jgi:transcriptional regulator with XRE-family HTH domain
MASRCLASHGAALAKALAEQFREEALEQGLSHAVLAERVGVSRQNIGHTFQHGVATFGTAVALAAALGYELVIQLEPIEREETNGPAEDRAGDSPAGV